jgi:hypothetical protein
MPERVGWPVRLGLNNTKSCVNCFNKMGLKRALKSSLQAKHFKTLNGLLLDAVRLF